MATITIDGRSREDLRKAALDDLGSALDSLTHRLDTPHALRDRVEVMFLFELLDVLGWTREPDACQLNGSAELVDWLRRLRDETQESIKYDQQALEHQEAGEDLHYFCGRTQAESVAISRTSIARSNAELQLVSGLLGMLDEPVAVA